MRLALTHRAAHSYAGGLRDGYGWNSAGNGFCMLLVWLKLNPANNNAGDRRTGGGLMPCGLQSVQTRDPPTPPPPPPDYHVLLPPPGLWLDPPSVEVTVDLPRREPPHHDHVCFFSFFKCWTRDAILGEGVGGWVSLAPQNSSIPQPDSVTTGPHTRSSSNPHLIGGESQPFGR